jgi:hypothetical protein
VECSNILWPKAIQAWQYHIIRAKVNQVQECLSKCIWEYLDLDLRLLKEEL